MISNAKRIYNSLGELVHIRGKASTQPQVLGVDIGIETVFSVVWRSTSRLSHKILLDISDILTKQSKGKTLNIAAVLDGIQILQGCPLWTAPWRIRGRRRQQWGDKKFSVISSPLRWFWERVWRTKRRLQDDVPGDLVWGVEECHQGKYTLIREMVSQQNFRWKRIRRRPAPLQGHDGPSARLLSSHHCHSAGHRPHYLWCQGLFRFWEFTLNLSNQGVSGGIFNAFCWTHATFTLPYHTSGSDVLQPGVGPLRKGQEPQEEAVYHGFYQWVGIS